MHTMCVRGSSSRRSSRQEGSKPTFTRISLLALRPSARTSFRYIFWSGGPDRTARWSRRAPAAQPTRQRPRETHWSRHRRVARSVRSGTASRPLVAPQTCGAFSAVVDCGEAYPLVAPRPRGAAGEAQLFEPGHFAQPSACRRAERRREGRAHILGIWTDRCEPS